MTEFNLWTFNSRVFPAIDQLAVRIGNLSMHDHPIHLHGYDVRVTETDGGWVPKSAQFPEITVHVSVGAMRAFEFVADEPGDWALHCHKLHHTMGPMEMGSMMTLLTVREGLAHDDYRNPGWYKHPPGRWHARFRAVVWPLPNAGQPCIP